MVFELYFLLKHRYSRRPERDIKSCKRHSSWKRFKSHSSSISTLLMVSSPSCNIWSYSCYDLVYDYCYEQFGNTSHLSQNHKKIKGRFNIYCSQHIWYWSRLVFTNILGNDSFVQQQLYRLWLSKSIFICSRFFLSLSFYVFLHSYDNYRSIQITCSNKAT